MAIIRGGAGLITRWKEAIAVAVSFAFLFGCTPNPETHSAIVQRAEQAGAGDLAKASTPSIEDWLRKHRAVATDVNNMCAPVREKANANWAESTEGRVCVAAKNAVMSTYRYPSDDKEFHSGWK